MNCLLVNKALWRTCRVKDTITLFKPCSILLDNCSFLCKRRLVRVPSHTFSVSRLHAKYKYNIISYHLYCFKMQRAESLANSVALLERDIFLKGQCFCQSGNILFTKYSKPFLSKHVECLYVKSPVCLQQKFRFTEDLFQTCIYIYIDNLS